MENNTQTPEKSKKGITISIIIVLVIIAIAVFGMPKKAATPAATDTSATESTETTTGSSTGATSGSKSTSLSRKEAQDLYQDKIVRITDQCLPEKFTSTGPLKKGTRIMLDNDGAKSHSVVFAGTNYTISAQGYRTVVLPNDGLVSSTCDAKTGVTTIVVAAAQ